MDVTPEQEQIPTPREVELGKWFRLFQSYAQVPHLILNHELFAKPLEFKTLGVGNWGVSIDWNQQALQATQESDWAKDKKAIVVFPDAERTVSLPELIDLQKNMELRFMKLAVWIGEGESEEQSEEWYIRPAPFVISTRLPSGKEYQTRFNDRKENGDWVLGEEKYHAIYVPDSANIMKQIEMKIEKIN